MKKQIVFIVGAVVPLCVIGATIAFLYFTRAPQAPSQPISQSEQLPTGEQYVITAGSSASFEIDEILRDQPFTVVGKTSEIAGTIDYADGVLSFGTIRVNARTFKTDSERRDGAIANVILRSTDPVNEFIVFTPQQIERVSDAVYAVTGDMTISGTTHVETLQVTLTSVTDTEIRGTATGSLKRSTYGLIIPDVPFVASVEDEFVIKADIIATK